MNLEMEAAYAPAGTGWWGHRTLVLLNLVESLVASAFGMKSRELRAAGRGKARVARARQVAIYLVHTRLGLTFSEAGACFDRDRTTAAHACRTIEAFRDDPGFDALLDCLERAVDLLPGFFGPGVGGRGS